MANKKITYKIGFDVNKAGLEDLKKDLKMIQSFTAHDLKIFDPSLANKSTEEVQKRLTEVHQTAADIGTALQKSFNTKLDTISLQDFEKHLKNTATGTIPQAASNLKNLGDVGKKAFFELSSQLLATKRELKETHSWLDKMSETLTNTVRWKIASSAIDAVTGSLSNAWSYAKRLDTSLNDIRIVTGKSADEMDRFAKKANQAAKSLGAATTNYSNAALIYYQQGLDEEDVTARAGVTVKAANVTGQSAREVSEQLTAVWNGYKVVAEEAELYVDKLAAVAAETAADLEELSTGMSKVASAAATMGVDVDQLSAQLSTIISVTRQDASVVGTALKTIYARMGDLRVDGVDEFGTTLGDVSGQLQQMGVDVLDQQGNLRDMGLVIEEVAKKWGTWTDAQRQAAAVAIAGKRQYNNLIALFENWDMYESSLTTSQNAAGTLQKQQDIYMDSLEAHLNKLTAAAERMYDALIDNKAMNGFIDLLTAAVDLTGTFVESTGGAVNILMALGPLLSKSIGKGLGSFVSTEVVNFQNRAFNKRENAAQEAAVSTLREANIDIESEDAKTIIALKQKQLDLAHTMTAEELNASDQRIAAIAQEIKKLREKEQTLNDLNNIYQDEQEEENLTPGEVKLKKHIDFGIEGISVVDESENEELQKRIQEQREQFMKDAEEKIKTLQARKNDLEVIDQNLAQSNTVINSGHAFVGGKFGKALTPEGTRAYESQDKSKEELETIIGAPIDTKHGGQLRKIAQEEIQSLENEISEALKEAELKQKAYDEEIQRALDERTVKYEEILRLKEKELKFLQESSQGLSGPKGRPGLLEELESSTKEANVASNLATSGKLSKKAQEKVDEKVVSTQKKLGEAEEKADKYVQNLNKSLIENNSLTQFQKETLENLIEEYEIATQTEGDRVEALKKISKALDELKIDTKEYITNLEEEKKAAEATKEAEEKQREEFEKEAFKKGIEARIQSITNFIGAASSLVATWNILQNLGNIWNDEDLTTGEKITQTITGIISVLMTLMPIVMQFGPALFASGKLGSLGIKAVGDESLKTGAKMWASLWPVLLIVGAIAAVAVGLVAVFAAIGKESETGLEKAQKGFDKAQKSAEEAKNTLADLRDEYNGLMSDISKYRDAETAIDAMRVGTEEWQKATEQLNQQVEELVEKYPELREGLEIDEYGNYRLNEDTISKVAATKKAQINEQKVIVAGANLAAEKARGKLIEAEAKEQVLDPDSTKNNTNILGALYHIQTGKSALLGSVEDRQTAILNSNFEDLITKIDESNEYSDKSKESLKEAVGKLQDSQKALEKNKEATDQLKDAYLASLVKDDGLSGEVYNNLIDALGIDTEDPVNKTFEDDITTEGGWFGGTWWGREELKIGNRQYWVGDTIDNNEDVKQVQEYIRNYAKAAYGDNVKIDDFGQLMDTGFREIGDHKVTINGQEMSVNQLIMANQTKIADQINAENTEKITDEMKRLNSAGLMQEAAYFNSTLMGDATVDWEGATLAKLDTISKYKGADYKTKTDAAAETLKKSIRDILGLGDSANVDVYSDLTETQVQHLKNSMDAANMAGAGDAIAKTVAGISDPAQMAEFQALLEDVNWTSAESVNQFRAGLLEAGIEIDNTGNAWGDFIQSVNSGMKQWIDNSKKVGENLAFIRDTVEGIELGSLISDEEYKKMVQINPEVAKYFVKTAGGMVAIANGKEIARTLKEQYKDLGSITTYFKNITKAVETSQGNANLQRKDVATPDAIKEYFEGNDAEKFANIAGALKLSGADNLLDNGDEKGIITKALDGDSGSIESLADMIMAVNQAKLDVANGEYNSAAAQQVYGTSVASSWTEAEQGVETWADDTTKQKVLDYWKTTYLSELGLNLSSKLIKAFGIKDLEKAVIAARKLELDYFVEINKELDELNLLLDKAFGKERQQLLQEQIELQKQNYDMAVAQQGNAETVFNTSLKGSGYQDLYTKEGILGLLNKRAEVAAEGGDATTLDTLIAAYDKVNETAQAAAEASYAVIDAQIESFKYAIDTQKQFKETVKEWKKFSQDFSQFTKDAGVSAFAKTSVADILSNLMAYNSTAYEDYASNDVETALSQMQAWANGRGENNPYYNVDTKAFDEAAYQADYDQYLADYQSYIEEMRASGQELYDSWFSALDEISAMYDREIEKLSTINSLLESSASLNQLFGKNSSQYFAQIRKNADQTVELYAAQVSQLQEQYNDFFGSDGKLKSDVSKEQADAVWEAYTAAQQNHANAIQAQYDAILVEFETSLKELVNEAFGGSLGNTSELWNMQKSADSMYFDDVNAEYEMYKFEREAQKAIDATGNIAAQNKLKNILNEQLAILQEKDKLGQYDIDRANAMYDLTLKQIALEEAQQTANKMKLTRDSLGNYTYQYVADEDKIAQAEEELAAAENNLYNLQKNHQSELIDTMISGVQEYQELAVKYMNDPAMFQEIREHYATFFGNLKEDMGDLGMNVSELTSLFNSDMSTPWMETFNNLSSVNMENLLNSTAALFSGDDGITAALSKVGENFAKYSANEQSMNARLSGYIESTSNLKNNAVTLAGEMTKASESITNLVSNIGTLVSNLEGYAEKYTTWLENAIGNEPSSNSENKGTGKVVEEAATAAGTANTIVAESTSTAAEASAEATSATNELAGRVDRIINIMAEEGVKIALNTDSKYSNSFEDFDQSGNRGVSLGIYTTKIPY